MHLNLPILNQLTLLLLQASQHLLLLRQIFKPTLHLQSSQALIPIQASLLLSSPQLHPTMLQFKPARMKFILPPSSPHLINQIISLSKSRLHLQPILQFHYRLIPLAAILHLQLGLMIRLLSAINAGIATRKHFTILLPAIRRFQSTLLLLQMMNSCQIFSLIYSGIMEITSLARRLLRVLGFTTPTETIRLITRCFTRRTSALSSLS
jgi:hypothetical protein